MIGVYDVAFEVIFERGDLVVRAVYRQKRSKVDWIKHCRHLCRQCSIEYYWLEAIEVALRRCRQE